MGIWALALGLVYLGIALLALKRGSLFAGGRITRSRITGQQVRLIAVPQAVVGGLTALVGLADLLGYAPIGRYSTAAILVLVVTYLVTNLGIGRALQARAAAEQSRRPKDRQP